MQSAIEHLVRMGSLPVSTEASASRIQAFEEQLSKVQTPISDDEARALVKLFGTDDCFGLAWTLLHLVETAPNWPIWDVLAVSGGEWIDRLRDRAA